MEMQTLPDIVSQALSEDVGQGDLTSQYFVPETQRCEARIIAKSPAVVAGLRVAMEVFQQVDSSLIVAPEVVDGEHVAVGASIMYIAGPCRSVLRGERVALNFLQQLSGVATLTRRFVDAVKGTRAQILDTRKTVPGLRALQKAAVVAGGGRNHRFGLYDRVMVKDNHLLANPSETYLQQCIDRVKTDLPDILVELEADTVAQVRGFLELRGVDIILLDNMSNAQRRECVALGKGRVKFEASGGVNLESVRAIAESGVDFISIGALTHSAVAVDFSLEITSVS
jgi:nicotinate-nucleotide pyrophosphorylase (carboxylating)